LRSNRWLLFGVILTCTVGVALVLLAWLPRPGINKQNLDRVQVGMTLAEVEEIFGCPPIWEPAGNQAFWGNNGAFDCATVTFDCEWRVVGLDWQDLDERSHLQRTVDRLLGRQPNRRVHTTITGGIVSGKRRDRGTP
jgi:hypothetical protein